MSTAAAFSLSKPATATRAETLKGQGRAATGVAAVVMWHFLTLLFVGVSLSATEHLIVLNGVSPHDFVPILFGLFFLLTLRPRGRRFRAPGKRLSRLDQPELFAALDEATTEVGVKHFQDVYVDGSARATVVPRDGLFGTGGRRTIVLGSALLQTMTVDHLRAAVAHEAARYYERKSGGSKFAALVERSRAQMRRGLDEVAGARVGLTSRLFAINAGFFLKATETISREHALATDDLVADTFGRWQLAEVLKITEGLPAVLEAYEQSDAPSFQAFAFSEEGSRIQADSRAKKSAAAEAAGELSVDERIARLSSDAYFSRPFDERPVAGLVAGFAQLARN